MVVVVDLVVVVVDCEVVDFDCMEGEGLDLPGQTSHRLAVQAERGKLGDWVELPCLLKEEKLSLSKMHEINHEKA